MFTSPLPFLARGSGRLIARLLEGDPVAWSIVGGIVAIIVIFYVIKAALKSGSNESEDGVIQPPDDEQR